RGATATQTYVINVGQEPSNHPPVIVSEPRAAALAGADYRYATRALDPDADPLNYALVGAPAGMTIAPATGVVTWKPGLSQTGKNSVTVRVADARGGFDTQGFVVEVTGDPPGEIRGTVFEDANENGLRDVAPGTPEPGLANRVVYLDENLNGTRDP